MMQRSVATIAGVVRALGQRDGLQAQTCRYALVSAIALGCDVLVYAGLLRMGLLPGPAGALGYVAGLCLHYRLSSAWVFPDRAGQRRAIPTFAKFAASGLIGMTMTAAVIGVLTGTGLAGPLEAKAIAVAVTYVTVFLIRRGLVFAGTAQALEPQSSRPR